MQVSKAAEQRARRAAKKVRLQARKSRWHAGSSHNYGGFTLIDDSNRIVSGERFDLTAEDVIDFCRPR